MVPRSIPLDVDGSAPRDAVARVERLYVRHHRDVYRWAMRYAAGDSALAEDVVQEVFVRLLGVIDGLDDDDELGRWLYRVTANRCLSLLRRRQVRKTLLATFGLQTPSEPRLDERLAAKQTLRAVFEQLNRMPPKERVVFSMLHLDQMPQSEIAATLGYSKGYVSKLVKRATERVAKYKEEVRDDAK